MMHPLTRVYLEDRIHELRRDEQEAREKAEMFAGHEADVTLYKAQERARQLVADDIQALIGFDDEVVVLR